MKSPPHKRFDAHHSTFRRPTPQHCTTPTHSCPCLMVLARCKQPRHAPYPSFSPEAIMAGFCRNCGTPLDDAQAFCAKCGTPVSGPPVRSSSAPPPPSSSVPPAQRPQSASQPRSQTPVPAPQAAAAPAKSGSNTFVKVLLIFVVIIFVFGAAGIAGLWYIAHRVKQKVHEIGLDDISNSTNATRGPALAGIDPCSLLSKSDVGQAVKLDVVRSEPVEGSDPGCQYSVMGDYVALVAKHASLLQKDQTNDQQRQMMESFA